MTLLERLQALPKREQTQDIATTLATRTGKAVTGAPRIAAIGEQQTLAAGQAATTQQRVQGEMGLQEIRTAATAQATQQKQEQDRLKQATQLKEQQVQQQGELSLRELGARERDFEMKLNAQESQRVQMINHNARTQLVNLLTDRSLTVDNLFSEFNFSKKELAFRRDAAMIEQRGFLLSLQDSEYMAELERVGKRRQLTDALEWREEVMRVRLGDQMVDFLDDIRFKKDFNADEREFTRKLQEWDWNHAAAMARAAARSKASRDRFAAISGLVTGGISVFGKK